MSIGAGRLAIAEVEIGAAAVSATSELGDEEAAAMSIGAGRRAIADVEIGAAAPSASGTDASEGTLRAERSSSKLHGCVHHMTDTPKPLSRWIPRVCFPGKFDTKLARNRQEQLFWWFGGTYVSSNHGNHILGLARPGRVNLRGL